MLENDLFEVNFNTLKAQKIILYTFHKKFGLIYPVIMGYKITECIDSDSMLNTNILNIKPVHKYDLCINNKLNTSKQDTNLAVIADLEIFKGTKNLLYVLPDGNIKILNNQDIKDYIQKQMESYRQLGFYNLYIINNSLYNCERILEMYSSLAEDSFKILDLDILKTQNLPVNFSYPIRLINPTFGQKDVGILFRLHR